MHRCILEILVVCFIGIGFLSTAKTYAQEDPVTLVSTEGESYSFPGYLEEISPFIKNILKNTKNSKSPNEISFEVSGNTLKNLQTLVDILPQAARDVNGKKVEEKQIDGGTIFLNKILRNQIPKKMIKQLSTTDLNEVVKVTQFLEIEPLTNVLIYCIVKRTKGDFRSTEWDVPEGYLTKHQLLKAWRIREYTVGDYIAEHGQQSIVKEEREGSGGVVLDLSKKKLTGLQGLDKIDSPEQIHHIILDNNRIQSIDTDLYYNVFRTFIQLRSLSIQNNRLSGLPKELFRHLDHLKILDLSGNQLSTLPEDIFEPVPRLCELNLDDNLIGRLPKKIFRPLLKLQQLSIMRNRIRTLPRGIFKGLRSVKQLSLSHNKLRKIKSKNIFKNLTVLEELKLDYNHLTDMPQGVFQGMTSLKKVDLRHNHILDIRDSVSLKPRLTERKIENRIGISHKVALQFYPQVGMANRCLNPPILCMKIAAVTGGCLLLCPCCVFCSFGCFDEMEHNTEPPEGSCSEGFGVYCCNWACRSPICYKN